jgi:hypothetical protein
MGMGGGGGRGEVTADINVTPMADVMLVHDHLYGHHSDVAGRQRRYGEDVIRWKEADKEDSILIAVSETETLPESGSVNIDDLTAKVE